MGANPHKIGPVVPGTVEPQGATLERVLGQGEDPATWSVPILRLRRTSYRLHVIFLLVAAAELMIAMPKDRLGPWHVSAALIGLCVVLLVREIVRSILARPRDGGQIIVWPLGLLSDGSPARPRPWLGATGGQIGGFVVGTLLAAVLLVGGAGWSSVVFHPLQPQRVLPSISSPWLTAVWWVYYANAAVLLFNFLPMPPLDGGRVLELTLRRRYGRLGAAGKAARIGVIVSALVFVAAIGLDQIRLMGAAVGCGAVCFALLRRVEFVRGAEVRAAARELRLERGEGPNEPAVADAATHGDRHASLRPHLAPTKGEDEIELDGVLDKISRAGLASLDDHEREVLGRATQRQRER